MATTIAAKSPSKKYERLAQLKPYFMAPVSETTLRYWITTGLLTRSGAIVKLKALRQGRCYFSTEAHVREFLEATAL